MPLTRQDLDQDFREHVTEADNCLMFGSGCPDCDLKAGYSAQTGTMMLICAGCGGQVAEIAVSDSVPEVRHVATHGTSQGDEDQQIGDATQGLVEAMARVPRSIRHSVLGSLVMSRLLASRDPTGALDELVQVLRQALPDMVRQRDLALSPSAGNG